MTLRTSLLALPFLLGSTAMVHAADKAAIIDNYANIAQAGYEDSLTLAKALKGAVEALIAAPTEATASAKEAWLAARVPYQQTEAFRFGNPTVDDWEGKVNAWPLDEGLIDYVKGDASSDENPFATANVIATPKLSIGSAMIDASEITPALLESLHEVEGIEPTSPPVTTPLNSCCGVRTCTVPSTARASVRPVISTRPTAPAATVTAAFNTLWPRPTC